MLAKMLCPCRENGGIIGVLKLPDFDIMTVSGFEALPGIDKPIKMGRRGHRR
ncbi:hypothetical protein ACVWXN_004248 [Bradyrhizobium sp. i1.4.4]